MALMVPRKRLGGPPIPSPERPQNPIHQNLVGDVGMDFGFDENDYEDDGPPYEPSCELSYEPPPIEPFREPLAENPVTARVPMKKPFRKLSAQLKDTPAETPATMPVAALRNAKTGSDKIQLSCVMPHIYHRRLKIYSIMNGKSILSILEEWIDQHCPPI